MPLQQARPASVRTRLGHRWVGAALIDLGRGENSPRAEHAARTGRHVMAAGTRIDVLEVYCADCRVRYSSGNNEPCPRRLAAAG